MSYYHFKKHDPRATCQICGFDFNRSALRKNWRGLWVCAEDYEPRNAQDFVRGVKDPQRVRGGAVPPAADVFLLVNAEAQRIESAFTTSSSFDRQVILDNVITALKYSGLWALYDFVYVATGADAQSAKIMWKSPGNSTLAQTGSVAFVPNYGFTPDGVSGYLDSQWDAATNGINWTQNSAHLFAISNTNTSSTVSDVGTGTSTNSRIRPRSGGSGTGNINGSGAVSGTSVTVPFPLGAMINRIDSQTIQFWRNGVLDNTATSASSPLSNIDINIGRTNSLFSNRQIAVVTGGGKMSPTQAAAQWAIWSQFIQDCADLGFYHGVEMSDDFSLHPDGAPVRAATGQLYQLNGTHNSIATVTSGGLVAIAPENSVATYTQIAMSQPGRHVQTSFSFSPKTTDGGTSTVGFWATPMDNDTMTLPSDSPAHWGVSPISWSFLVWSGGTNVNLGSEFWGTPLLTDGTIYTSEVFIDRVAATALVIVSQGSTVLLRQSFTHPLIGSVDGSWAFIEHFRSQPTDSLPSYVDWSAG